MSFRPLVCLAVSAVFASGLVACGSSTAQPYIAIPQVTVALPGGGSILTFAAAGGSTTVTVSELGYAGLFEAISANTQIATVAPPTAQAASARRAAGTPSAQFTITAVDAGTTTVAISDAAHNTFIVTVIVNGVANPLPSPSSIAFTALAQTQTVTVSEPSYTGTFTAASGNSAIATVSPATGTSFTVTAVGAGSTTLTFTDAHGGIASVAVGVTITNGVIARRANAAPLRARPRVGSQE